MVMYVSGLRFGRGAVLPAAGEEEQGQGLRLPGQVRTLCTRTLRKWY